MSDTMARTAAWERLALAAGALTLALLAVHHFSGASRPQGNTTQAPVPQFVA